MHINRERLLDRFLQYVKIGTTANPNTQDYPSSRGQWLLGELLVKQLRSMGIEDAEQDVHGLPHDSSQIDRFPLLGTIKG